MKFIETFSSLVHDVKKYTGCYFETVRTPSSDKVDTGKTHSSGLPTCRL